MAESVQFLGRAIETLLAIQTPRNRPNGEIVLQYPDKNKVAARNNPERMHAIVEDVGFAILEEDTNTLPHSP